MKVIYNEFGKAKTVADSSFFVVKFEKRFYEEFSGGGEQIIEAKTEQDAVEIFNNTTGKKQIKENEKINAVEVSNIGYFAVDNPEEARQMFGNSDNALEQYRLFRATYQYNKKKREGK